MTSIQPFEFEGDGQSPFDRIKQHHPDGAEYWSARDLMQAMGYSTWQKFENPLDRAIAAARKSGQHVDDLFTRSVKKGAGRPRADYLLGRYAAYLVAMNGDPNMPEVAAAQSYFAIRTREAEALAPSRELTLEEKTLQVIQGLSQRVEEQHRELITARPKAKAWDDLVGSKGTWSFNEAAAALQETGGVNIGRNRLFKQCGAWGYLYREGGNWMAYQRYRDQGLFEHKLRASRDYDTGDLVARAPQVRITGKGLNAIRDKLIGSGAQPLEVAA